MKHNKPFLSASLLALLVAFVSLLSHADALPAPVQARVDQVMPEVVAWRRDIHQHPELGNREFRTAAIVTEHLQSLGMEVHTDIAHTGVVGILHGAQPGPRLALRADMDALPVTEMVDLPFASAVRTTWAGQEVGVMHACGHDNHVAILMGTAEVLAGMRESLNGSVMFIFQPAEEGPPPGEDGGAELMLREGLFDLMLPDAIFGLHVMPAPVGSISVRSGGMMASSDGLRITVHGEQTHGAQPWSGIDPIVVASQVVLGLQTITSRQLNTTLAPAVVTIGTINGGVRGNIIPDRVEMVGTLRSFDPAMRQDIHQRVTRTAEQIAAAAGARAEVDISLGYPVTVNDADLVARMTPTLQRVAGDQFGEAGLVTGSEDFSYYAEQVPGLFFFLGVAPDDPAMVHPNHSPYFYADERALPVGVQAMTALALDFLGMSD